MARRSRQSTDDIHKADNVVTLTVPKFMSMRNVSVWNVNHHGVAGFVVCWCGRSLARQKCWEISLSVLKRFLQLQSAGILGSTKDYKEARQVETPSLFQLVVFRA